MKGEYKVTYIKEYWTDKEKRAEQAKIHTENMEQKYGEMIKKSVKGTIQYFPAFKCEDNVERVDTEIILDGIDSVSAIFKYESVKPNGKMAVLNFASYKNPGGMFINGSKAQEECLCHESFLYNVLKEFRDFYEWNCQHKNKALYLNRALYSPDIMFIRNGNKRTNEEIIKTCDVITCAAPNKSAAQRYQNVSDVDNFTVLDHRIRFVLDIAKENQIDTLILGAYGCGVFGQNPIEVASLFKGYIDTYKCFEKVVFAIPKGKDNNFAEFEKVFRN